MAAEIAILNSHGIALAANSAVAIMGQKVYNSAKEPTIVPTKWDISFETTGDK